jgi:hypothetical protein
MASGYWRHCRTPQSMALCASLSFGRRQTADIESVVAAHGVAEFTGRPIDAVLDLEARWISRGGGLAFGSSCLLVARKAE